MSIPINTGKSYINLKKINIKQYQDKKNNRDKKTNTKAIPDILYDGISQNSDLFTKA